MKNYQPILMRYMERDLREAIRPHTNTIVDRLYENGNSRDTRRNARPEETTILFNLMYAALLAIRQNHNAAEVAINTAEYAVDLLLPGVNGYMSLYCPLCDILKELETDLQKQEASLC